MKEIYITSENKALITITHRHSSVLNCDKVYFLDKRKIIDEGKYADLKNMHAL